MKKILVTGSEGYIGSVLVPMLLNNGYNVVGLDACYYSEGNLNNYMFPQYNLINKDIRDIEKDDFNNSGYYAIIHLAALSNDPLGMLDEKLTYDINYKSTVKIAELAKSAGVERFIFASSVYSFGTTGNLYTTSKIASELIIENYNLLFGLKYTILRYPTAYGPRNRNVDAISIFVDRAVKNKNLIIHGNGKQKRNYLYVEDLGEGSTIALDKKLANNEPELLQEFDRLISVVEDIATKERGKILLNRLGNPEKALAARLRTTGRPAGQSHIEGFVGS